MEIVHYVGMEAITIAVLKAQGESRDGVDYRDQDSHGGRLLQGGYAARCMSSSRRERRPRGCTSCSGPTSLR